MNMENKINIAELLKDCPSGMELDSPMFEGLEFKHINKDGGTYPIVCCVKTSCGDYNYYIFTKYGCFSQEPYSKCVIFPKGKTTWEGFQRPFKDGDIIYNRLQRRICIYHYREDETPCIGYFRYNEYNKTFEILNDDICIAKQDYRFATEEEKEKLFKAIQDNGYKWNVETKTLEKLINPKFKVGDVVQYLDGYKVRIIKVSEDNRLYTYETLFDKRIGSSTFSGQDELELVQNRFDISTLKPFESRVLVRRDSTCHWIPEIFGFFGDNYFYVLGGCTYKQCIPYEGNEHLLGSKNDCDEFYKSWE